MVRIHPITLQFDDEEMERELRTGTRNSSYGVLILFFILDIMCRAVFPLRNIMFDPASDKSTTIAHTCITITYATVLIVLRHAHFLPWHEAAKIQDLLWLTSWVINVAVWGAMVHCGLARRLTSAEGQFAAIVCTMWGFVMVIQHVVHIGFRARIIVLLMAASIALTSVAWRKELLAALMFGEALGYSMEHMARSSYLPRAKSLEDARIAKERSDYDLRLLVHRRAHDRPNGAQSSRSNSDGSLHDSASRELLRTRSRAFADATPHVRVDELLDEIRGGHEREAGPGHLDALEMRRQARDVLRPHVSKAARFHPSSRPLQRVCASTALDACAASTTSSASPTSADGLASLLPPPTAAGPTRTVPPLALAVVGAGALGALAWSICASTACPSCMSVSLS